MLRTRFMLAAGTAALAQALAMPAAAQVTDQTASDTIVVVGSRPIAESEAAALQTQRNSDSLVAVASSDGVGRLPDQNIAQATSRLPGVAVESDQGQARYISLRGAPNYWTTLSFDGINVVSPEGRDARFDSIPSAIAAQIVVAKAVTPDMPGETVAGNVNVITRSAFDYAGLHVAGRAGYGIAGLGNRDQYEGSLVLSDRFDVGGGEIGLLVSGSYYERQMVTDNFEIDWEPVSQDRRPGFETRFWAQEAENKLYRLTRRNWSVSGRLDYRPDPDNTISLRSVYTIFTDDEARDNYRFDLDDRQADGSANTASCSTVTNLTPTNTGYADVCIGNTPYSGTFYGIDIRQRSTLRAYRQSIFTNTLAGDHTFGDGWTIDWLANYTQSKDDRSVVGETTWESPSTRTARPSVAYDFTNPNVSHLRLFTTSQLSSPTRYAVGTPVVAIDTFTKPLGGLTVLDAVDTTDAYTGRLIVDRETRFLGADAVLRTGFQFDQRTKVVDESNLVLNAALANTLGGIPTDYNQFSLDEPFAGALVMDYTFRYFDTEKMRAASAAARAGGTFNPVTNNIYDVREQVYAGFIMGTLDYDWGSVVGGVRVERVENRGIATGITAGSNQTLAFPSLHLNFDVTDEQKLRVSFNTGAARADYDQMRPNVVIDDANATISGGNPAVQPERAYGVDAYYEYYIAPQGYLMVGAFYKRVEDVLYRQRRAFGSNALDSNGIDRSGYVFTGITNGGDGRIYGMEAAAQLQLEPWTADVGLPDWMGGFGFNANLTINDSRVLKPTVDGIPDRYIQLPGTSDAVYNVGLYYEKYGFSARVQYRNRTAWLDGVADTLVDGGDTYWASDDEMDFSMRYAVTPNFEIYFDAANLLNNPGRRFSEPGNLLTATGIISKRINTQTIEWEQFGRRYTGGVRFNF
jgi:TonB-dependent receptor